MKRCGACGEEFENQFNFCAVDGKTLFTNRDVTPFDYRPTIIDNESLPRRLFTQAVFLVERFRLSWFRFKASPRVFLQDGLRQVEHNARRTFARAYLRNGLLISLATVLCLVVSITLLDKHGLSRPRAEGPEDVPPAVMIDLRTTFSNDSPSGVGVGEQGRVGLNSGRGEGSHPTPARAQGGGGGGDHSPLLPSQGRPPVPSLIPAPILTTYARLPPHVLPAAGIDMDPVLWKDLPFRSYGDPRSKSTPASNGSGEGGGVGTNRGTGIGEGNGPGIGPGNKGNIGGDDKSSGCCGPGGSTGSNPNNDLNRIFRQTEVDVRARVISKPEPQYTEEARRNQITGTVILNVVFSRTGEITNIHASQTLCCGLTEKAIVAARQIRFVPATRNGQTVSVYMQLEYNFNLY
ncbi:MAG: energy transducer TonB [Pyrinomonadaceae bacterium]